MALRTSKSLTNETVKLISKFKSGELKPISTGSDHLDETLLGGLLPGTVLGIVGRSSHGKSYDAERIQEHILKNEPDVVYINCNWELSHFKLLVRSISKISGKSAKQVLFDPLTDESTKELNDICNSHRTDNVFYQNEPVTAEVFSEDIEGIIARFPDKKIVVSIDNLENILNSHGGQKESMDFLLSKVNRLKNAHWFIAFIVLNQMNNNYTLRMDDIRKQRPIDSDCYGSDQLLKLCDVLYVKMIPWKLGIREKFFVFGKDMYPWLEEFKLYGEKETANFDPFGTVFIFYLKQRQPEDEKNIKDIFAERMFNREDSKFPVEEKKSPYLTATPIFGGKETIQIERLPPVKPNSDLANAFGPIEANIGVEDDDDAPF